MVDVSPSPVLILNDYFLLLIIMELLAHNMT